MEKVQMKNVRSNANEQCQLQLNVTEVMVPVGKFKNGKSAGGHGIMDEMLKLHTPKREEQGLSSVILF